MSKTLFIIDRDSILIKYIKLRYTGIGSNRSLPNRYYLKATWSFVV